MRTTVSYFADFVLVPLYVLAAVLIQVCYAPATSFDLTGVSFVAGWFVWTFAEYAIHRWIFHVVFPRQHWLHHLRPTSMTAEVSVQSGHSFLGLFIAYLASVDLLGLNIGTPLFAGICAGYWAYSFVHFAIHHMQQQGTYFRRVGALHGIHHRQPRANYGIQTSFWDRLLGTYQEPRKK